MIFPEASASLNNTMSVIAKRYDRELSEILELIMRAHDNCETMIDYHFRSTDCRTHVLKYLENYGYRTFSKEGDNNYGISWNVPTK